MTLKPSRDSDSTFLTKNPKELYAPHSFPPRLGSLRVALSLEVRAEAPWEETQGRWWWQGVGWVGGALGGK